MGTIVVGYVGTPEGRAALRAGIEQGRLRGAKVVVVNSNKGGSSFTAEAALANDADLAQVDRQLDDAQVEHEVRGLVLGQDPPVDILDVAGQVDAELIVIGLRQRSPVGKLLLGSNAQRILLEADVPVLAVKAVSGD